MQHCRHPVLLLAAIAALAAVAFGKTPDECPAAEIDAACDVCSFNDRCEPYCLLDGSMELVFLYDFKEGVGNVASSIAGSLPDAQLSSPTGPLAPDYTVDDVYNDPLEGYEWLTPRGLRFPTYEHNSAFCSDGALGQALYDVLQDPLGAGELTFATWVGGIEDPGVLNGPLRVFAWEENPSTATINIDMGFEFKDPPGMTFRTFPDGSDYSLRSLEGDPDLFRDPKPDLYVATISNGTMIGYENGVAYNTRIGDARYRSTAWKSDLDPSFPMCIGASPDSNEPGGDKRQFQGDIYMVAMWNRAFSEQQVVDMFLAGPEVFVRSQAGFCGNVQGLSGLQRALLIGAAAVIVIGAAGVFLVARKDSHDRFSSRMSILNKVKRQTTDSTYSTTPSEQLAGLMEVARPKVKTPAQRTPSGDKDKTSAVRGSASGKFQSAGVEADPARYGSLSAPQQTTIPMPAASAPERKGSPPKRRKSSGSKKRKRSGSKMAVTPEPGLPSPGGGSGGGDGQ